MAVKTAPRRVHRDPTERQWDWWLYLRWLVDTGRDGPRTVKRKHAASLRGLVTLMRGPVLSGICRRPDHAALPKHGARH